jgi:hypothetical protein
MRRLLISLLGVLLSATSACSPRDFLTRRLAFDLIAASERFQAKQQFWLQTGNTSNKQYFSPEYLVFERRGWISGTPAACAKDIQPAPCWDIVLTPIGAETLRDLILSPAPSSEHFSLPTAARSLVEITGISQDGPRAEVDFRWKWVPLNEVGAALYAGDLEYNAGVGFKRYDDGWRLSEGSVQKSEQGLEDALKNSEPAE